IARPSIKTVQLANEAKLFDWIVKFLRELQTSREGGMRLLTASNCTSRKFQGPPADASPRTHRECCPPVRATLAATSDDLPEVKTSLRRRARQRQRVRHRLQYCLSH